MEKLKLEKLLEVKLHHSYEISSWKTHTAFHGHVFWAVSALPRGARGVKWDWFRVNDD